METAKKSFTCLIKFESVQDRLTYLNPGLVWTNQVHTFPYMSPVGMNISSLTYPKCPVISSISPPFLPFLAIGTDRAKAIAGYESLQRERGGRQLTASHLAYSTLCCPSVHAWALGRLWPLFRFFLPGEGIFRILTRV